MDKRVKNIWEIRDLLGLRHSGKGYEGTFTTGAFDQLFDYDAGLLFVSMRRIPASPYSFMISISTVDDGVWQAEDLKQDYTEEEADQRTEEIANDFLKREGIVAIAAFSDMTAIVGSFYPTKYKHNINTDTFIVKMILHSKDLNEDIIRKFWKKNTYIAKKENDDDR